MKFSLTETFFITNKRIICSYEDVVTRLARFRLGFVFASLEHLKSISSLRTL